jgi:hypothetical protein
VSKPLPCPWCREDEESEDLLTCEVKPGMWHVCCSCGARGPIGGDRDGAIFQWNRRSMPIANAAASICSSLIAGASPSFAKRLRDLEGAAE